MFISLESIELTIATNCYRMAEQTKVHKIILAGEDNSGRTVLFEYLRDRLDKRNSSASSMKECRPATVRLDDENVLINLWDNPSRVMSPRSFFRNADGIILVYDSNNVKTLYELPSWMKDQLKLDVSRPEPLFALWGYTESGMCMDAPAVTQDNIEDFKKKHDNMTYSAKVSKENVVKHFETFVEAVHKNVHDRRQSKTELLSTGTARSNSVLKLHDSTDTEQGNTPSKSKCRFC